MGTRPATGQNAAWATTRNPKLGKPRVAGSCCAKASPVLLLPKWTTSSWLFWHLCLCHNISKTVTELYYLPYLVMVRLTWHNEFIGLKAQCSLVPVSCLVTSLACFSQLPDLEHRRIDSLTDQEWMFLPEGMSMCHPVFQQMHFETQF